MAKGFGGRPGMGGMGGINMNMIKQAQKMQQEMQRMQAELQEKEYTAQAGGGAVEAVDPEDMEMLQDMIVAAVNEALRAAESDAQNSMQQITGGLGLPF